MTRARPSDQSAATSAHCAPDVDPFAAIRLFGAISSYDELINKTAHEPPSIWFPGVEADSHIEVSGPSGEGKTTFAILFAVARANPTGRPVRLLGRDVTPADVGQRVIFVEEENGLHNMRRKLEEACDALGLPVRETIDRMILLVRAGVISGDDKWEAIRALGRRKLIGLVVIDSRARILRGGESNSEDDQAAISNELHRLVEDSGAPVLVVSHTKKGEKGSTPDALTDVSGSVQRAGGADVVLLVTARRNARGEVLCSRMKFAKLRDNPGEHPALVTYTLKRDQDGHHTIESDASEPAFDDDESVIERVFSIIETSGDHGITKTGIGTMSKDGGRPQIGGKRLEPVLSELCAAKRIDSLDRLVNGKPAKHYFAKAVDA
ncbi:MAG: AAA family ATPase [Polyangiales bacterium]